MPSNTATLPCNLSRSIVALQVAKLCCPYYQPRKQLVAQQILSVASCINMVPKVELVLREELQGTVTRIT